MIEKFKTLAIEVLSEKDPKFELPKEERLMANVTGNVPRGKYTALTEQTVLTSSSFILIEDVYNKYTKKSMHSLIREG